MKAAGSGRRGDWSRLFQVSLVELAEEFTHFLDLRFVKTPESGGSCINRFLIRSFPRCCSYMSRPRCLNDPFVAIVFGVELRNVDDLRRMRRNVRSDVGRNQRA